MVVYRRLNDNLIPRLCEGKISLVHEALKYLEAENGTTPTLEQLSDFTKLSCEELTAIKEFIEKES